MFCFRSISVFFLSIAIASVLACGGGKKKTSAPTSPTNSDNPDKPNSPPPAPKPEPELPDNFTFVEDEIIKKRCLNCHLTGNGTNHGIDLSSYQAITESEVFPPLVIPGKPEESSLYTSLKTGRMPKGSQKLSDREIEGVFKWIKAGAKNRDGTAPKPKEPGGEPTGGSCAPDEPGCD